MSAPASTLGTVKDGVMSKEYTTTNQSIATTNDFHEILKNATFGIQDSYFQTCIIGNGGKPKKVYRERVYCYELYHQMRKHWPCDGILQLHGEFDKSGSKLLAGTRARGSKPDFLVHTPGSSEMNLIAMEVKPVTATTNKIECDLQKLSALYREANYCFVIYLIFGKNAKNKAKEIHSLVNGLKITAPIEIWAHDESNKSAEPLQFNGQFSGGGLTISY